jgi:flavin-dependent dehydrogenase
MDDSYDLVVIGAGPAGEVAAQLAAAFGRKVLIVERNKPGGVVTTTGRAPTKALREAALYLTGYRQEEVYGVRAAAPPEVVMPTLGARIEHVRDVLQEVVAHRLAARGIAYLQGIARRDADRIWSTGDGAPLGRQARAARGPGAVRESHVGRLAHGLRVRAVLGARAGRGRAGRGAPGLPRVDRHARPGSAQGALSES